jgi:hypothetical protein
MTNPIKPKSAPRSPPILVSSAVGPRHRKKLDGAGLQSTLEGSDVEVQVGLGAAIAKMDCAIEQAREADDARAIGELRRELGEAMKGPDTETLTRPNLARVLRTIVDRLRPSTSTHLATLKTGEHVVADHPAIALLCEFLDNLDDLDSGKTHAIFKSAPRGATAALTAKQRERDRIWLTSVEIIRRRHGLPTKSAAESLLAAKLQKAREMRRGKPVSARSLKNLRDHLKRSGYHTSPICSR